MLLPTPSTEDIFCQIIVPKKSKPSNRTRKNRLKWSHSAWPQLLGNSSIFTKYSRQSSGHRDVSLGEVSSMFLSTTRPHQLSSHID